MRSMNIKKLHISDTSISFIITNKLKTTKRFLQLKVVKCVNSSNPALDVCSYVLTSEMRITMICFYPGQVKSQ